MLGLVDLVFKGVTLGLEASWGSVRRGFPTACNIKEGLLKLKKAIMGVVSHTGLGKLSSIFFLREGLIERNPAMTEGGLRLDRGVLLPLTGK